MRKDGENLLVKTIFLVIKICKGRRVENIAFNRKKVYHKLSGQISTSTTIFGSCECMQIVKCTLRVAVVVVGLSHRYR